MTAKKYGAAQIEVSIRDRVGPGLAAIQRRMASFASGMTNVGGAISRAGTYATAAFTGLAGALAFPTILAARLEQTTVAFETMLGSGEKAQALLEQLRDFAAATPLSFDEITDASKKLLAFGVAAEDVEAELRRVGDIASGIGAPIGEIAEIYGKAKVQGRLFAEDINQLTGRGIPIIQELAKQFGIAESEVKSLVESGKVNFGNLQRAFVNLTAEGGQFGGMMAKQSKTLGGLFSTLKDNVLNALIPIGQAVSEMLKPVVTTMISMIEPVAALIRENARFVKILVLVTGAGLILSGVVTAIGGALVVAGIALSGFVSLFGVLSSIVAFVVSPLGMILVGLVTLVGVAIYATDGISKLTQAFTEFGTKAVEAWGGIADAISAGNLQLAGEIAFAALNVGWLTLTTSMKEVWASVSDFFRNIWLDVVKSIIDTGASIYFAISSTFDRLGVALAHGFDVGFTYIVGAIDTIQNAIAKAIISTQQFFGMYSEEQGNQIRESLDAELQRRAQSRQEGLGRRQGARVDAANARDESRRSTADAFGKAVKDVLDQQRVTTTVDRGPLDAAQKRLADLNMQAAKEAEKAASDKPPEGAGNPFSNLLNSMSMLGNENQKTKAIGTTSAAAVAAGALGFNTRPMEDTAKNTALLVKYARRNNGGGGFR